MDKETEVMRHGALVNADDEQVDLPAANARLTQMGITGNLPSAQNPSNAPQPQQNQQNAAAQTRKRKQRADAGKPRAAKPKPILLSTGIKIKLDIETEDGYSLLLWLIESGYGDSAQELTRILADIADEERLERLRNEQ